MYSAMFNVMQRQVEAVANECTLVRGRRKRTGFILLKLAIFFCAHTTDGNFGQR